MRLSRIAITNFRNFKALDVQLGQHAVMLGENKVGKTNLLFALRLILDPALPDSMRRLRLDDFWDGLPRPLTLDDAIEISVEFQGFERARTFSPCWPITSLNLTQWLPGSPTAISRWPA